MSPSKAGASEVAEARPVVGTTEIGSGGGGVMLAEVTRRHVPIVDVEAGLW